MAEVKVKITAQNQTQTGFQAVLADAQKTASQVQQTFARATESNARTFKPKELVSGPMKIDIGDYGLDPLRQMVEDLRRVRQGSQEAFDPAPLGEFNGGIAGVIGRFALLIGSAAGVGKIIALAFDQLSNAIRSAITVQEQFNQTLQQAGQATSLGAAVSEFEKLRASAEQTTKVVEETFGRNIGESLANAFSGRPGQLLARAADFFTGGAVRGELTAQEEQQRRISRDNTRGNLARLAFEAEERTAVGGDPRAIERLEREQQKRRELENFRASIQNESPETRAEFENLFKELQAEEDKAIAARERLKTEQELTKEKEKQAAAAAREAERTEKANRKINQDIALAEAKLRGDKGAEEDILQQRDIDRTLASGGTFEQASNLASTNALQRQVDAALAAEGQGRMTGSFGASSLQRIGLASNEFFDTRRREDPAKATAAISENVKRIVEALKNPNTLVMKPDF